MATASRLPETLTAAQRAQQLGTPGNSMTAKASTNDRMMRALSLDPTGPATAAHKAIEQAQNSRDDELDGTMMTLNVEDIHTYDKDPRTGRNPKYDEIKSSLLAQGNHHRFAVTKRPGDSRFFVAAGGNTRLRIIQELWETTGDKRWKTLDVVYRKWRGETSVIVAHLAENEARGDTTFWEKAQGIASLRAELQLELAGAANANIIADTLRKSGMERGLKYVQTALFCVDVLQPIGPFLSFKAVNEVLAPSYRALVKLGDTIGVEVPSTATLLHECVVILGERLGEAAPKDDSDAIAPEVVLQSWHGALARHIGVTPEVLAAMLVAQQDNPRIDPALLQAIGRGEDVATVGGKPALAPATAAAPAAEPVTSRRGSQASESAAPPSAAQRPLQPMLSAVSAQAAPLASGATVSQSGLPALETLDGPLPAHVSVGADRKMTHPAD